MTWQAELDAAAARATLLGESLSDADKAALAASWAELQDELDDTRSDGARTLAVLEWRAGFEAQFRNHLTTATGRKSR